MAVLRQRTAFLVAACLAAATSTRPMARVILHAVEKAAVEKATAEREAMRQRLGCNKDILGMCILPDHVMSTQKNAYIVKVDRNTFDLDALQKRSVGTLAKRVHMMRALSFVQIETEGEFSAKALEETLDGMDGVEWGEIDHDLFEVPEQPDDDDDDDDDDGVISAKNNEVWHLKRIAAGSRSNLGEGVHAFIIDSGMRVDHKDFGGRASASFDWWKAGTDKDCQPGDAECAQDGDGHGTHVGGSVGGATSGVAPKASLYAVRVLNDKGIGSFSSAIGGLDYVAGASDKRPAVVTLSLGAPGQDVGMTEAVTEVINLGVTVLVASGNEHEDACGYTPNNVPGAIVVGATDADDELAWFSNYGSCVDIYAPGDNIKSNRHDMPKGTTIKSGTSMACPVVAGAAALLLAATPSLSAAQVLQQLQANAAQNSIDWLSSQDQNNLLLYVGADAPPPAGEGVRDTFEPAPTPAPTPAPPPTPAPTPAPAHVAVPAWAPRSIPAWVVLSALLGSSLML